MVTRRQFLGSLARAAVAPAACAGGLASASETAARPAPRETGLFPDIWGQPENYFETLEIGADRDRNPYERVLSDVLNEVNGNDWKKVSWPSDRQLGHRYLRIHWNKDYRSGSFAIPIFRGQLRNNDDPTEGRVVHCRYMVRVSENFPQAVVDGGKWLGFCSAGRPVTGRAPRWPRHPGGGWGPLLAGNGGANVHGNDGWSARGGYTPRVKGASKPGVPIFTYAYALDRELFDGRIALYHEIIKRYEEAKGLKPGARFTIREPLKPFLKPGEIISTGASRTGCVLKWDYTGSPAVLVPGQWHRVDQVMAINTPGARDGWIRGHVDGQRVANITKVRWRNPGPYRLTERYGTKTTLGIGAVWANFYQGGGSGYKRMTDEAHIDVYGVAVRVLEWDA